MEAFHLHFAWAWMLTGMVAGAAIGLFFHRSDWLGGFDAWPRRMVRLAHIAFLGTGLLNVAFALSLPTMAPPDGRGLMLLRIASTLLVIGAATMPTVCLLAAWRKPFRHLFFIPASSLIGAAAVFLAGGLIA